MVKIVEKMSRNANRTDANLVITHPDIVDISVIIQGTLINNKPVAPRKKVQKRQKDNSRDKSWRFKGKFDEDKSDEDREDEINKEIDQTANGGESSTKEEAEVAQAVGNNKKK